MNVAEQIFDARHDQARDNGQRFHARRTVTPPETRPGLGHHTTWPRPRFSWLSPAFVNILFSKILAFTLSNRA